MKPETLEIVTKEVIETQQVGFFLAEEIIKGGLRRKKAMVIGLEGELGSGKTTFVQGLAKGLGIKEKITSPTFVILKKYEIRNTNFYHIDCYRLNSAQELLDLGFKEIIIQSENLVVIEWAERVRKILLRDTLWIKFEHFNENKRGITIK